MSFKEVQSLDADVTVALGKRDKKTGKAYPTSAEGYYLGSRSVQNKRGESQIHFLQTSKGNLGLWGTTDLNRKISSVPAGTMIRVTSTGTRPTPNGDMYMYKVETDSSNTIDVGGIAAVSVSANSDADEGYNTSNEEEESDEDYAASTQDEYSAASDVDGAQALALAAAERKAKVAALLKGTGNKAKAKN